MPYCCLLCRVSTYLYMLCSSQTQDLPFKSVVISQTMLYESFSSLTYVTSFTCCSSPPFRNSIDHSSLAHSRFWSPDCHCYRTTVNLLTCPFMYTYMSLSFLHVFCVCVCVCWHGVHIWYSTHKGLIRGQYAVVSVLLPQVDSKDGTQVGRL